MRLHLVERSKRLCALQAAKLATYLPVFHDTIASLPRGPMLLIANEFLDALPIQQFERARRCLARAIASGWMMIASFLHAATATPSRFQPPPTVRSPNAAREEPRLLKPWHSASPAHGGAALFVDYGYYPSASGDTLQAMRDHQFHPILDEPGCADLTASCRFRCAIAEAAEAGGARKSMGR